jgi:hypothetical protein
MPLSVTLAFVAFAVVCIALVLWMRSRKSEPAVMPLTVKGLGIIGWHRDYLTRADAVKICGELTKIRAKVIPALNRIYGIKRPCVIEKLIIDPTYPKPAEWSAVHAGILCVNPSKPLHRSHFAEELHNQYRREIYGANHIYEPISQQDRLNREAIQQLCREFQVGRFNGRLRDPRRSRNRDGRPATQ